MVAPNMTVCHYPFYVGYGTLVFLGLSYVSPRIIVILSGNLGEGSRRGQFPFGLPPLFRTFPIVFSPLSTTIYHTLAYFAYATIVGSRFLLALAAGVAYLTDRWFPHI
jgi:hypothetical protein